MTWKLYCPKDENHEFVVSTLSYSRHLGSEENGAYYLDVEC